MSAGHPAYRIDPVTLREVLEDPGAARDWCAKHPDDPLVVAYWRMLGEFDHARDAGQDHLAQRAEGSRPWTAAGIRLAQVRHWRAEYAEAHDLLDRAEAVAMKQADDALLAFVAQHRAKALLDEGRLDEAASAAEQALALRRAGGQADLVASSEQVLAQIELRSG